MSLEFYLVGCSDEFEVDESMERELSFPCFACRYKVEKEFGEHCGVCEHNANYSKRLNVPYNGEDMVGMSKEDMLKQDNEHLSTEQVTQDKGE